jgi:macrolide transport system ATP-binding/permease protein
VRVALGAQRVSIYKLVLADAGWLTGLGIVTGLIGSIAATAFLRRVLFGVSSWDLATLAAVSALLGISAISASYIPARRAASVDPIEALRAE